MSRADLDGWMQMSIICVSATEDEGEEPDPKEGTFAWGGEGWMLNVTKQANKKSNSVRAGGQILPRSLWRSLS